MRKMSYTPKWKIGSKTQNSLSDNCHAVFMRNWRIKNLKMSRQYQNEWAKNRNKELRIEIINILGGKCVRCDFSDFRALQIDHINGKGTQDRRQTTNSYAYYLRILKQINFGSKDYQLLCANCNWIKRLENKEDNRVAFR